MINTNIKDLPVIREAHAAFGKNVYTYHYDDVGSPPPENRDEGYIVLFADDTSDTEGNHDISYILIDSSDNTLKEGTIFDDSATTNYNDTTPQIAVSEEGLAVVAWHSSDGNIYIKKYLF